MTLVSLKFVGFIWVASGISSVLYGQDSNVEMFKSVSGEQIVFSNFVVYLHSLLNVSAMESHSTETPEDCQDLCLLTPHCFSINVAIHSNSENRRLCQLLSTNKEGQSEHFVPSNYFNHFTTVVSIFIFWKDCLMQAFFLNTGISIEIQNSVFFHILFSDKTKLCIFSLTFLRQQTFHF